MDSRNRTDLNDAFPPAFPPPQPARAWRSHEIQCVCQPIRTRLPFLHTQRSDFLPERWQAQMCSPLASKLFALRLSASPLKLGLAKVSTGSPFGIGFAILERG